MATVSQARRKSIPFLLICFVIILFSTQYTVKLFVVPRHISQITHFAKIPPIRLPRNLLVLRYSNRADQDSRSTTTWRYVYLELPICIRKVPDFQAPGQRDVQIFPLTDFEVSEERLGDDGILYLRLADGRGWVFEHKPGLGIVCMRVQDRV